MIATIPTDSPLSAQDFPLERVIAEHGPWKVLGAALVALLRRDPHPPPPIDNRLRRDIGLELLPEGRPLWQLLPR